MTIFLYVGAALCLFIGLYLTMVIVTTLVTRQDPNNVLQTTAMFWAAVWTLFWVLAHLL